MLSIFFFSTWNYIHEASSWESLYQGNTLAMRRLSWAVFPYGSAINSKLKMFH